MTKHPNHLSDATQSRIIKAVEAGVLNQKEIARAMGCSDRAVQRCVARYRKEHPEWSPVGRMTTAMVRGYK